MKNIIGTTFVLALTLCGCGDGGSDSAPPPPPTAPATPPVKRTGYFLNVKGVRYKSCGGYEGVTGDRGAFDYASYGQYNAPDCLVTFSIGKMQLGYPVLLDGDPYTHKVDALVITPYDLVKYDYDARFNDDHSPDPIHEPARNNILTMLESLTARPNSRGVIEISTETDQFADSAGWSILWGAPDFRDRATALLGPANKTLVETTQAINDYAPTVNCRNTGYYDGFGSGGHGTTQVYDSNGKETFDSIDLEVHGVVTPDGNAWLYLMDKQSPYNPVKVVDYDVWSGTVAPGAFGLGFNAVGSKSSGAVYFEDGFNMAVDNATQIGAKDWTPGRFSVRQDERANAFTRFTSTSPHYFDLPVLKFAGRNDTHLLSLEVFADNTVRMIVNDAKSDTKTGSSDAALLSGSVSGDTVTAESTGSQRSYKAVGTIDLANMTVSVTVTVTTPTQPDPQPYMSITAASGCTVSPTLDAT